MKKLARVVVTLTLAAVVLTGCGDDDNGGTDTSDATPADPCATQSGGQEVDWGKPATGPAIKGSDRSYTYRVPQDWADVTARAKKLQPSVDSAASEKAATDGFADNINVGFQRCDGGLDPVEDALPDELAILARDLEVLPRVNLDGVEAVHARGPAVSDGTKYFLERFAALKDDRVAIITFTFSRELPEKQRETAVSSVMASWKWAS